MQKIPTLFNRDPQDMRHLLPEVTPGCEWVLAGEGVATRKYDGTCCMFDGQDWWARREVKPGKQAPDGFLPVETDEVTGKTSGWEPMSQSGYAKWHDRALERSPGRYASGTYELIGPKVNGNPEGVIDHILIEHAHALKLAALDLRDAVPAIALDVCKGYVLQLPDEYEGIVWHHPDGRMAKLKRRDFT